MARKHVPTALKILRGNPGKRAINKSEPQFNQCSTKPPTWLDTEAKREWRRLHSVLTNQKVLTDADYSAFAVYCQAYSNLIDAKKTLAKSKPEIETTNGNIIQHPAVGRFNSSAKIVKSFMSEFGLTPSSRVKLSVPQGSDDIDTLSDLMNGSSNN